MSSRRRVPSRRTATNNNTSSRKTNDKTENTKKKVANTEKKEELTSSSTTPSPKSDNMNNTPNRNRDSSSISLVDKTDERPTKKVKRNISNSCVKKNLNKTDFNNDEKKQKVWNDINQQYRDFDSSTGSNSSFSMKCEINKKPRVGKVQAFLDSLKNK